MEDTESPVAALPADVIVNEAVTLFRLTLIVPAGPVADALLDDAILTECDR